MITWLKRKLVYGGSILYPGNWPLRKDSFSFLKELRVDITEGETKENAHWTLILKHPQWGEALLWSPREPIFPPAMLVDLDPNLIPAEKEMLKGCGCLVFFAMEGRGENMLRERKLALRFMHAIMKDDAIALVDHVSEKFWSKPVLDVELSHEADLDVESLYTLHAVYESQNEGRFMWLHTHGLSRIGRFDFDLLDVPKDYLHQGIDFLRALAFSILEEKIQPDTPSAQIAKPHGVIRMVPASEFTRKASRKYLALRDDPNREHQDARSVVCEPGGGFLANLFGGETRPSRFFSSPVNEQSVINFSTHASELMRQRALGTYQFLRDLKEEWAEFPLPFVVKIGLRVDGGGPSDLEHLWFEAHSFQDATIDATLANEPFQIAGLKAGQRGTYPVEQLSDWQIFTPAGPINPRSIQALRFIRENKEQLRQALHRNSKPE